MNKDTKIEVSIGCVEFLTEEVQSLRNKNDLLGVQVSVMNNFFSLVNRLEGKQSVGYGEDRLWKAKNEISKAIEKVKSEQPKPLNEKESDCE